MLATRGREAGVPRRRAGDEDDGAPRARACTGSCRRWPIAAADYAKRVPTGALNRAIRDLQVKQPAPTGKIRYAVQGATEPPTFTLFIAGRLPQTYLRYVERQLA